MLLRAFACFCVLKRALACLSVRIFLTNLFCIYYLRVDGGRSSTCEHVRARSRTQKHAIARNSSYDGQTENLEPQYYGSSTGTLLPQSTILVHGPGSLTLVVNRYCTVIPTSTCILPTVHHNVHVLQYNVLYPFRIEDEHLREAQPRQWYRYSSYSTTVQVIVRSLRFQVCSRRDTTFVCRWEVG